MIRYKIYECEKRRKEDSPPGRVGVIPVLDFNVQCVRADVRGQATELECLEDGPAKKRLVGGDKFAQVLCKRLVGGLLLC